MRHLKKLCATCVLTFAFALPTFAGEMLGGVTAPPPPPPSQSITGTMTTGVAGNMEAGVTATDPATDVFLSLLQRLLSLF